ncbi:MAG: TRAP transporter fused permease subunit, partial [Betaproteobacteria bacterium]|nr:TRAP transporter fused permease subunit [Betaproteobacteria bacterium]
IPLCALVVGFDVPGRLGAPVLQEQFLGVMLTLLLASVFIGVPAVRGASRRKLPWYDAILALLGFMVGGYLVIWYPRIVNEVGELTPDKVILGWIALALVMEACRRMTGWVLLVIAAVFLLYAHYSHLFPGMLNARGISWSKIAVHLYIDPNSLLGIPLAIVATIVVAFILFGQVLFASGGGEFFTNIASALLGRFRGGAAKMSVVSGALFGTISGSPVANVVMTGTVSIPLMKKTGYQPHVAGAVESVASTGGQLMPPVMGAAAFVMAEFLHVPYAEVALAALLPAVLYYLALFVQVDLEAGKMGITRVPPEEIPPLLGVLKDGWIFIFPIALIVYLLFFLNLDAAKAAYFAAALALPASYLRRESRIGFRKLIGILEQTGLAMLEVGIVCAMAGIIIGVLTLTGLAFTFTLFVDLLGTSNLFLILVMTALVSLILGMGMPTTAVYVIVALTLAPALTKLGIQPMAAHLFVFYYAMLSMITPPICIAAFAGAALAGANAMRTGYTSTRLGIIAYLVPFVFIFDPLLLFQGPALLIVLAIATAAGGTVAIGIAMAGYFVRPLGWLNRVLLAAGGIALLIPPGGTIPNSWAINAVGAAVSLAIVVAEWRSRRAPTAVGQARTVT